MPESSEVPNPAGPDGRDDWRSDGIVLSGPARRMVRLADHLPDWLGSVRFRLTALYSLVLFGLAAFMVAGLYAVLATRLNEEKVYVTREVTRVEQVPGGFRLTPTEVRAEYRSVEQLAYARALSLMRTYSASALALLFLASLGVGWMVAGRVLAPIGRITAVARDIQATDLSRRIALRGPPDELKELADTFDAMLSRLDDAFEGQQRFIQEASHELRNPLAVIRTNLDVALADPGADADDLRQTAELVGRSAERMSRLVDDLLVYARRGALPYLRQVYTDPVWTVWEIRGASPLGVSELPPDGFTTTRAGPVRIRWSPYFTVVGGRGCVRRAQDGYTEVDGPLEVRARASLAGALRRSEHCRS